MAVVHVFETNKERSMQDARKGDTATRSFIVIMDDKNDGAAVAKTASDPEPGGDSIPSLGALHDDNTAIKVDKVDAQPTASRLIFEVLVFYVSSLYTPAPDPTDDPWDIDWGGKKVKEIVTHTKLTTSTDGNNLGVGTGEPIMNTAGDWFDPPLQEDQDLLLCVLSKNMNSYDVVSYKAFVNKINDASVTIADYVAAKWSAKVVSITGDKRFDRDSEYWRVVFHVLFKEELWIRKVKNVGLQWKDGSGKKNHIVVNGTRVEEPHPLNADGTYTEANPTHYYLQMATLNEAAFSGLGLPTSM